MTNTLHSFPPAPAQPGYHPGYEQAAPYATLKPYSGKAIAGFVVSLVGVGIVGIILSILGLKDTKDGEKRGRGLAIAGIVIGAGVTLLQLVVFAISIAALAADPTLASVA